MWDKRRPFKQIWRDENDHLKANLFISGDRKLIFSPELGIMPVAKEIGRIRLYVA